MFVFLWTKDKHQQMGGESLSITVLMKGWTTRTIPSKVFCPACTFESAVCASLCCRPCQLGLKKDVRRYVPTVVVIANTRFRTKLYVRNSLVSHLARCPRAAFFLRFVESHLYQKDSINLWNFSARVETFWITAHIKLDKNHAHKTKGLNQRAQRHWNHRLG